MKRTAQRIESGKPALVELSGVDLNTPNGRPLFRGLDVTLTLDHVAVIGRNGVGKSSLLAVLAGETHPSSGNVTLHSEPFLVPQTLADVDLARLVGLLSACAARAELPEDRIANELASAELPTIGELQRAGGLSLGEFRKLYLLAARLAQSDLLLLDEPTQDLDAAGARWLMGWLTSWPNGLVLVSHDRALLWHFRHFVVVAESGCRHVAGTLADVEGKLEEAERRNQERYVRRLNILAQKEQRSEQFRKRRERKKNVGRVRELGRMTPRSRLNQKRSYAQENQGRIAKIRQDRIAGVRTWAKAARRALSVNLPLEVIMPSLPYRRDGAVIMLDDVSATAAGRPLFGGVNIQVGRDKLGVVGPNGSGKTTLLRIMTGAQRPVQGTVCQEMRWIGTIAQGGTDWMTEESLLEHLARVSDASESEEVAKVIVGHRFPLALAKRPMSSLSPGERVRAALICLFARRPTPEILVLDEPTYALDFLGTSALRAVLKAWSGGLVVVSHDHEFLEHIGVCRTLVLDGNGGSRLERPTGSTSGMQEVAHA